MWITIAAAIGNSAEELDAPAPAFELKRRQWLTGWKKR